MKMRAKRNINSQLIAIMQEEDLKNLKRSNRNEISME